MSVVVELEQCDMLRPFLCSIIRLPPVGQKEVSHVVCGSTPQGAFCCQHVGQRIGLSLCPDHCAGSETNGLGFADGPGPALLKK